MMLAVASPGLSLGCLIILAVLVFRILYAVHVARRANLFCQIPIKPEAQLQWDKNSRAGLPPPHHCPCCRDTFYAEALTGPSSSVGPAAADRNGPGGIRTLTPPSGPRILSPLRLPFRHGPALSRHSTTAATARRRHTHQPDNAHRTADVPVGTIDP